LELTVSAAREAMTSVGPEFGTFDSLVCNESTFTSTGISP
jgi:hypothetical protein